MSVNLPAPESTVKVQPKGRVKVRDKLKVEDRVRLRVRVKVRVSVSVSLNKNKITRSLSNAFRQFTVYVRINIIRELFKPVEKNQTVLL